MTLRNITMWSAMSRYRQYACLLPQGQPYKWHAHWQKKTAPGQGFSESLTMPQQRPAAARRVHAQPHACARCRAGCCLGRHPAQRSRPGCAAPAAAPLPARPGSSTPLLPLRHGRFSNACNAQHFSTPLQAELRVSQAFAVLANSCCYIRASKLLPCSLSMWLVTTCLASECDDV